MLSNLICIKCKREIIFDSGKYKDSIFNTVYCDGAINNDDPPFNLKKFNLPSYRWHKPTSSESMGMLFLNSIRDAL